MADLPEVVLKETFDFLGIWERLQVRSTCKKWKFVADTLSHQRSVCIHSTGYPYNERWCFSNQRVTEGEMVHLKPDPEVNRPFDLKMKFFQNLRKVYLFYLDEKVNFFLDELNQLTRLRVLMIEEDTIQSRTLNSPSLEVLSLGGYHVGHLQLNTPNLSSLTLWNDSGPHRDPAILEFEFPLKLKHLRCTEFTHNLGSQLKSLETLVCVEIPFDFRLGEFESLAKAELWSLNAFRTVQDQKKRLNRKNLQVLASGFDGETVANNPPDIQEQFFCEISIFYRETLILKQSFLEKAGSNQWKLAGSVPWKFKLDNFEAFGSTEDRISQFFFCNKFRTDRIFYSERDEIETDQFSLVDLTERCSQKEFMTFSYTLKNSLVERLSRIQSTLRNKGICSIKSVDCLLNLKNLESLQIYSPKLSIKFICRLFKELKHLYYLYYHSSESSGFHLHIDFYNYKPEDRVLDGIAADTLYGLHYQWRVGNIMDPRDLGQLEKMDFKNLNELIEGVKKMSEDEVAQRFFF